MNFKKSILFAVAFAVFAAANSADAHMAFKKQLAAKYAGTKVSCNACHVKGKPKSDRNEFGKLFSKELKKTHPNLTKDFKSKKGADKKAFEKSTVVPAFDKALKLVKVMKEKKSGKTYDELIKAFEMPEITKDPKYKPEEGSGKKSG